MLVYHADVLLSYWAASELYYFVCNVTNSGGLEKRSADHLKLMYMNG
jgi:cytochrome c oxidase assembly protein Cox11